MWCSKKNSGILGARCWVQPGHLRLAFLVLILVLMVATSANAKSGLVGEKGTYRVSLKGDLLSDALSDIQDSARLMGQEMLMDIVGDADVPLTVQVEERTVDRLVHRLVRAAGFLAVQRGNHFTIYAEGAEDVLYGDYISYVYKLRSLPVESALDQVDVFSETTRAIVTGIPETSSISIIGELPDVKRTVFYLESIDNESAVVMIELLVVQYRHGNKYNWGIDVTSGKAGRLSSLSVNPGASSTLSTVYNFLDVLDPSFTANVSALVQDNRATVVTNPHIAVRNGQTASIELAQEKYVTLQRQTNDNSYVYELEQLDAGVTLEVLPTVTADGLILLDINGVLSVFVPTSGQDYAIDRNTIQTSVNVRDGQTLIIGGLINRQENKAKSGVPILRDLPFLRSLFGRDNNEVEYFETVLYITPHIYPWNYEQLGYRYDVPFILKDVAAQEGAMQENLD